MHFLLPGSPSLPFTSTPYLSSFLYLSLRPPSIFFPTCSSHPPPPTTASLQHSSLSDDSEVENIMQDPHHEGGHGHHHHQHHDHKHHHHHDGPEPHDVDADREAEGEDRPHTPSYLRPPVAGRAQSDSGLDPSLPQSRSVEFDLSSSVSSSRPKSPWGRFDPYDNNEVTWGGPAKKPREDKQDLCGLVLLPRRHCLCVVMCEQFIFKLIDIVHRMWQSLCTVVLSLNYVALCI